MALLTFTSKGLYCEAAGVYIDPVRKVDHAVITHAHADHARPGHGHYLCSEICLPVLRARLGKISAEGLPWREPVYLNGVRFSFHPAGHIVGSAQVRVEHGGEVWVVSGDYKTDDDGLSGTFEAVRCHTFVTESTFALPLFRWPKQEEVFRDINAWWQMNRDAGLASVIDAYSLGKAQRILAGLDLAIGPVYAHSAVIAMNKAVSLAGLRLPEALPLEAASREALAGSLILAPASGRRSAFPEGMPDYAVAGASGWMQLPGRRRSARYSRGFALSDHADWAGLNAAVEATGAETVYVDHGYTAVFARWLQEKGYDARVAGQHQTEAS